MSADHYRHPTRKTEQQNASCTGYTKIIRVTRRCYMTSRCIVRRPARLFLRVPRVLNSSRMRAIQAEVILHEDIVLFADAHEAIGKVEQLLADRLAEGHHLDAAAALLG